MAFGGSLFVAFFGLAFSSFLLFLCNVYLIHSDSLTLFFSRDLPSLLNTAEVSSKIVELYTVLSNNATVTKRKFQEIPFR